MIEVRKARIDDHAMIYRLGLHRPRGAGRASAAGQGIRLHGWRRLCRASVDSIL